MRSINEAKKLLGLVEDGTSPFHVVKAVEKQLLAAGFVKLSKREDWSLDYGGRYYVVHNGSTLAAFTIGKKFGYGDGVRIAAAHTDFPGLRVKPAPQITKEGYIQLNVEVYGGAILNTWLDRPLSASGRVALKGADAFHPEIRLVDFYEPFLTIPNLAIHLNKDVNKGVELNRQKHMLPVVGLETVLPGDTKGDVDGSLKGVSKSASKDTAEEGDVFLDMLASRLSVDRDDILDYEMGLYNTDSGAFLGQDGELLSSPRLDNLTSVQAVASAITESERAGGLNIGVFFDHEEIGSKTKQGAGSMLLSTILERIFMSFCMGREKLLEAYEDTLLLSVDVGHAIHPNYTDKNDLTNKNVLGRGICFKEASNQAYATDCGAVAVVQQLCEEEGIPYQKFANRSDGTGGSTLGSIASSFLPVKTVDLGVPLLAMHSSRELMGTDDQDSLTRLLKAFYSI